MITIREKCVRHHRKILLTPHGRKIIITSITTDRRIEMKAQTGKQASMTVSIKTESGIESYFFYDMEQYGAILKAIDVAQTGADVAQIGGN
jgi:hypothetical protein